jgi:hypothetical protein
VSPARRDFRDSCWLRQFDGVVLPVGSSVRIEEGRHGLVRYCTNKSIHWDTRNLTDVFVVDGR